MPNIPAMVFSLEGYFDAYDMVRPLGLAGIPAVVASRDRRNIAFYSRYCTRRIVLPPSDPEGDQRVLAAMTRAGAETGERPVLYYSSDPELMFIWKYREQLEPSYRYLLPTEELLKNLFNKVSFSLFALENGMPVPHTVVLDKPDHLADVISSVRYPCIVKPAYSHDWIWDTEDQKRFFGWYKQALRQIDSESRLREFCSMLPDRHHGILIQSYVDGADNTIVSFHGYFDENAECLGSFMGQKIRTYPPKTGGSVYVRTIVNEELRRRSIRHLNGIGFRGIVKIDYKWDRSDGEFKILEINPRYNLWEVLGTYAGINLISLAHRHQTGERISPDGSGKYTDDLGFLFFKMDLRSYLTGYRKSEGVTFLAYLRSLFRKSHYRAFALSDPRPAIVSAIRFVGRVLRRVTSPGRVQRRSP